MTGKSITLKLLIALVFALLLPAQILNGRGCHVLGLALTGSLVIPACDEGGSMNSSANVTQVTISNTDSSSHTVTIQDCQTSPFYLANAMTVPAATDLVWAFGSNSLRFGGCFKWSASSTTVLGSVTAASN